MPVIPQGDDSALPAQRTVGRPAYRLINDTPIFAADEEPNKAQDTLRTGVAAKGLADLILDSRDRTPFTLAIDGGWGAGKSSLMHQIEHRLMERDPKATECVWFNAWTARGEDALEGLIKSVLLRFDRNVLRRAFNRAREHQNAVRLLRSVVTLLFGFHVGHLVDRLWKQWKVDAASRNELRGVMKDLANDWMTSTGGGDGRRQLLVVFIDDLDRCSDETVHAVLDAIKIYLDIPGLVFVLGFDHSRLARQAASPEATSGRPGVGVDYMEKIVQAGYRLPPPTEQQAEDMILSCARASGIDGLLAPHLAKLLAERTSRNPRRIKRLINSFVMYQLDPEWWNFVDGTVLRTVLLHQLYPEFHRAVSTPNSKDLIADFVWYHQGRKLLQRARPDRTDPAWAGLGQLAAQLGIDPPDRSNSADWPQYLTELERQLPEVFRLLSADADFAKLVTELYEAPDSEALRRRFQRMKPLPPDQGPRRLALLADPPTQVSYEYPAGASQEPQAGLMP
jgi:hypothetical protein